MNQTFLQQESDIKFLMWQLDRCKTTSNMLQKSILHNNVGTMHNKKPINSNSNTSGNNSNNNSGWNSNNRSWKRSFMRNNKLTNAQKTRMTRLIKTYYK